MTLQNGLVHGGEVRLWCDTAYVDPSTGKVAWFDTKAFEGLTWPFAGTLSLVGATVDCFNVPAAIASAYPANVAALLNVTREALIAYSARGGAGRVLLGAWEDEPQLWIVASDGAGLVAPFEPAELDFYTSSGNRSAAYQLAVANGFTPERMLTVIDAQRAEPHVSDHVAALGEGHWIGGNCVELAVRSSGVTSRVVREWGDRAGERIEPAMVAALS